MSLTSDDNDKSIQLQISALQKLIHSIGNGKLSTDQTLPLAQRILSSSIIQTKHDSVISNPSSMSATNTSTLSPSLVKKIQRYYLKNTNSNTNNNNDSTSINRNAKNDKVNKIISNIQTLYRDFVILENHKHGAFGTSSNTSSSHSNIQIVYDTLKILYRLAGTDSSTGTSANNTIFQNKAASSSAAGAGKTKYHLPTTTIDNNPNSGTRGDKESMSTYSFNHVKMALQNEEQTILRECIHALQYINGEVIQFHNHLSESNNSWQDYDNKNIHTTNDKLNMVQSNLHTIQIHPGLLPFHIEPKIKVQHKGTRLVSTGSLDALHICGEGGWLYSRIMNYIEFVEGICNDNVGVVPRALASALREELKSYYTLLSSFEKRLLQQQQYQMQKDGVECKKLTCRQLMIELRAPISQLRSMAIMIDGVERSLNGGRLLRALYLHSIHGDMRHVSLVNRILYSASLPWYDMLYDWCINGVLLSAPKSSSPSLLKFDEFFIQENNQITSDDLWHGRYILNSNQIGLVTESLANQILIVGKGINFIRKSLNDSQWTLNVQKLIPQKEWDTFVNEMKKSHSISLTNNHELFQEIKKFLGFHYDFVSSRRSALKDLSGQCGEIITQTPLEITISAATQQVHKHILTSLFEDHYLVQHLRGLKEILFLGQGDFICTLMDLLHVEFESEKGVDGIYMHNMIGILHEAFRSTNAKFLPDFVLQRIRVQLLPPNDKSSREFWVGIDEIHKKDLDGWDIFSLGYDIQAPLTAVVHPASMKKYHEVFDLLFRLKRIEWMLNSTWRQSTVLNHALQYMISKYSDVALGSAYAMKQDGKITRMKRLLRTFSLTRQTMLHFVSNFQSYLMYEVLESGWKSLVTQLRNAKTLDEVIHAHDDYLNKIIIKSLLETLGANGNEREKDGIGMQLRKVLSIAYKFCKTHEKIFSEAIQSIDKIAEKRRGAERRSKAGKWGFDKADPDVEGTSFYHLSDDSALKKIMSISEEFDFCLKSFLSGLHDKVNGIMMDTVISSPLQSPSAFKSDESESIIQSDDSLRFLTFRLDFSEFYSE